MRSIRLALLALLIGVSESALAQMELKFGHVGEPGSLFDSSANEFAKRANAKLGDKARVVVFGSSQLGGDKEMLQKLKLGTLDFALPSTVMSSEADLFGLFEMPYLVKDRAHMARIEREIFWPKLEPAAEAKGLKILAVWENGYRHITNSKRPIVKPADLQGIKLRVPHESLAKLHPADIAEIVEELSINEGVALLETMDDETAAEALEEVAPEKQVSLLQEMESARAADILEEMDPDDAADVLGDMSEEKQQELLGAMQPAERGEVRELLGYPEDTAGGIMTTEYLAVPVSFTVAQTMERLRAAAPEVDVINYIYVVADMQAEELLGVVSLRRLIVASPQTPIRQLMNDDPVTLHVDDGQEHAARVIAKYNLVAAPVVDARNRLQGIVTVDDAIDIILPTAWKKRLPRVFA